MMNIPSPSDAEVNLRAVALPCPEQLQFGNSLKVFRAARSALDSNQAGNRFAMIEPSLALAGPREKRRAEGWTG